MARILIVDDSALSRRMLCAILEAGGHEVTEAENGLMGLERFSLERPELIMLDMTMADMQGLDVLDKILEVDPNARVLAASADIQVATRKIFHEKGGRGFIEKPFVAERVLSVVEATLKGEKP